ncbi:GOLD domain-containing protein [Caerostris extrusa]|uniref:GOLD domain-containing protein n=1 Tax=Caerostris extrusa TaxID=172846 RepID=A0AAV4PF84_CAEEX|nr:GOLD domain-containing protein [Caerostris extrusa]
MEVSQHILTVLILLNCFDFNVNAHEPNFDLADMEFTTIVKAKDKECFYQYAKPKQTLRFEYRVVDAGFSKLDIRQDLKISFYVISPNEKVVVKETKKSHGIKSYVI